MGGTEACCPGCCGSLWKSEGGRPHRVKPRSQTCPGAAVCQVRSCSEVLRVRWVWRVLCIQGYVHGSCVPSPPGAPAWVSPCAGRGLPS